MLWILVLAAIVAVAIVFLISRNPEDTKVKAVPTSARKTGIGSPIFLDIAGRKPLVEDLQYGMRVCALTPYGPQKLKVTGRVFEEATLENDSMIVNAKLDQNYFQDSRLGRSAWRTTRVVRKRGSAGFYAADAQRDNRRWIRDESIWGDDFDLFDWMVMYHFMFDGFQEPFEYYDTYHMPVYEDLPSFDDVPPPIDEIPFNQVEEEVAKEPVAEAPAEVNEETNFNFEPVPEPEPEPYHAPEPEPEPERYRAPDPEPYSEPDTSYDSGSDSYDSGGSDD